MGGSGRVPSFPFKILDHLRKRTDPKLGIQIFKVRMGWRGWNLGEFLGNSAARRLGRGVHYTDQTG
jgi:hypothetical protein